MRSSGRSSCLRGRSVLDISTTTTHHSILVKKTNMADAETQTQAEKAPQIPEKESLIVRLDELLEKYLETLDQYQKARQELSTQLSSVSCPLNPLNLSGSTNLLTSPVKGIPLPRTSKFQQSVTCSLWPGLL